MREVNEGRLCQAAYSAIINVAKFFFIKIYDIWNKIHKGTVKEKGLSEDRNILYAKVSPKYMAYFCK